MNNFIFLTTTLLLTIFCMSCAEKQKSKDDSDKSFNVNYPFMIESGAISRRSAPAFITIEKDSVRVYMGIKESLKGDYSYANKDSVTRDDIRARLQKMVAIDTSQLDIVHSVATSSTEFHRFYAAFNKDDLEGETRYNLRHMRDGGYTKFTNPNGTRTYSNILYKRELDVSRVKPDTIGLSKFKSLYNYAAIMLQEIREKEKSKGKWQ